MTASPLPSQAPPTGNPRWGVVYIKPLRTALLVLLAVIAANRLVVSLQSRALQENIERQIRPAANALTASLDQRIALLRGLTSFLSLGWGRPSLATDFTKYTDELMHNRPGIRSAGYTVNGIIQQTWPVGSRRAPGVNVLVDPRPEVVADLRKAMADTGITLTSPISLSDGGFGLIARMAVRDSTGKVVALAAVVVDRESLMESAGLNAVPGLRVMLVDENGRSIAGQEDLGSDLPERPIEAPIHIANRTWQLRAVPEDGWNVMVARLALGTRLGFGIAFVLIGIIMGAYGGRNNALAQVAHERAKQRGEEKFVKLFAMTPDGVVLTRLSDGMILEVNPGFSEICHRPREALVGRTTVELGLWPSQADRDRFLKLLLESDSVSGYAVALQRPDEELRETRISGRVFTLDGVQCVLNIVRDVHEQRLLERRLEEAARLEAVGRLAGGVAHDFNNLITGISGYSEMLLEHLKDDPVALSDLREITRAANRAANLTKQLLAFARRQMVQPRVVNLNDLVLDSNPLLRSLVGEAITLVASLSPEPAGVLIDPAQGDQLLTNLCINARDAMPAGGLLKIQVITHEQVVNLVVSDSGTGIPAEVMPHLFEPFYTTKAAGRGTGLGLATCYGIMQQAGGRIEVTSRPGEGATFTLIFPRIATEIDMPATEVSPQAGQGRPTNLAGETVLVAEDEVQVRRLCERLLRNLGYNVLTSENGAEALAVAAAYPGTIDLLLTDMVMPVMGGAELMRNIASVRPGTRVLRMSGYSDELVAAERGDVPFMAKPFTPADLADAVRKALSPEA